MGVAGITSSFQDTQGDGGPGRTQGLRQLLLCGDRASGGKEDVGAFGRPRRPGTQKPPPWARLHMGHRRERRGLPVLEEGRGQGQRRNRDDRTSEFRLAGPVVAAGAPARSTVWWPRCCAGAPRPTPGSGRCLGSLQPEPPHPPTSCDPSSITCLDRPQQTLSALPAS